MFDAVADYVTQRQCEFGSIDVSRRTLLDELSRYIRQRRMSGETARLIFVCAHNSRRSHMAHLWAVVAAAVYGLDVATFSGGTEATAFNPGAVAALERAGFRIEKTSAGDNPTYVVRFSEKQPGITCFSKKFDAAPNPKADFAAVMVCGEADTACPAVAGASARFSIPFVDPKVSDGTPQEAATYDERCAQIAREMLYVMSRVAN
ncbi:MAG: protein-tyrosine-phosphatase [Planctomycetota bacterium]